jgi:hypothetical protein
VRTPAPQAHLLAAPASCLGPRSRTVRRRQTSGDQQSGRPGDRWVKSAATQPPRLAPDPSRNREAPGGHPTQPLRQMIGITPSPDVKAAENACENPRPSLAASPLRSVPQPGAAPVSWQAPGRWVPQAALTISHGAITIFRQAPTARATKLGCRALGGSFTRPVARSVTCPAAFWRRLVRGRVAYGACASSVLRERSRARSGCCSAQEL